MPIGRLAPVANGHWPLLLYRSYTCYTHGVKAFQSDTALQRYTVYITIQLYTFSSRLWKARIILKPVMSKQRNMSTWQAGERGTELVTVHRAGLRASS